MWGAGEKGRGGAALTCFWIAQRRVGAGGSCDRFSCLESFNNLSSLSGVHSPCISIRPCCGLNFGKKLSLHFWLHYTIAPQPIVDLFVCHLSIYLSIDAAQY